MVTFSSSKVIPKILATIGAKNPFIEVKTALVLFISANPYSASPKKWRICPTANKPRSDTGSGLKLGEVIKKMGSIIILAINSDDPVNAMGDTFGII